MTRRILIILLWLAMPAATAAHGVVAGAPTFPGVLLAWSFDPLPITAVGFAAVVYLRAVRVVNAAHPRSRVPRRRVVAWLAGLTAIALALQSPIDRYESSLLSVHMIQHMLLQFVAAPLLLLGAPVTLALRVASPNVRAALLAFLHGRVVRVITHPIVAWSTFAAVNWFWQFSPAYDAALELDTIHYLQHATFLTAALLFWWPIAGVDPAPNKTPYPARVLYLTMTIPQTSFFGVTLMNTSPDMYPHYATLVRNWGPSLSEDVAAAGSFMWGGGAMKLGPAVLLTVRAGMRDEDRRATRREMRSGGSAGAERDRREWLAAKSTKRAEVAKRGYSERRTH